MTEYEQWLSEQPKEFQREILGNHEVTEKFKDYNFKSISLQQLRELDDKYN
jgi:hypothetical protein